MEIPIHFGCASNHFDPSNLVFSPKAPILDFHQFLQYLSEKRAVKCKIQWIKVFFITLCGAHAEKTVFHTKKVKRP
jgi:hypothetical protein